MKDKLDQLLVCGDGLVASALSSHSVIARGVASGRIVRVLPGVFRDAASPPRPRLLARALALHDPQAVVTGRAAAALTWWPELEVGDVTATRPGTHRAVEGFRWTRELVPEPFVQRAGGVTVTAPALGVLDLATELGSDAIDTALRRRAVTVDALQAALAATPGRPGNNLRARLVRESRDNPWSPAERILHSILRSSRLPWPFRGNHRVETGPGAVYVDAALPALRLGFEVDGFEFHGSRSAFEDDRLRIAELGLVGWRVYGFAASTLWQQTDRIGWTIRQLTFKRARELGIGTHPRRG